MDERYRYVFIDYFATGEGRTIFGLVVTAGSDQEALERMKECVGDDWYSKCSEVLSLEEFIKRMGECLPTLVENIIRNEDEKTSPYFEWYGRLHCNYS